ATRRHFDEAAARIQSIARVHERLYRGDSVEEIDLLQYIKDLCHQIADSGAGDSRVQVWVHGLPVALATDRVIPVALILNELLTNAV
ncbi:histidine kinase dimerization/phosphoacceptor domain -containing protein, partial [Streptomyces galilaeus]|uniref:histidine kinase dimerization/phosphoacceptor domain -containing protein n=1 Tax=Streptomyces galilaeus TaxID=33899 RepID=UPI0038F67F43